MPASIRVLVSRSARKTPTASNRYSSLRVVLTAAAAEADGDLEVLSGTLNLFYGRGTRRADRGPGSARAHVCGVLPATLALAPFGPLDLHVQLGVTSGLVQSNLRNDEQHGQLA